MRNIITLILIVTAAFFLSSCENENPMSSIDNIDMEKPGTLALIGVGGVSILSDNFDYGTSMNANLADRQAGLLAPNGYRHNSFGFWGTQSISNGELQLHGTYVSAVTLEHNLIDQELLDDGRYSISFRASALQANSDPNAARITFSMGQQSSNAGQGFPQGSGNFGFLLSQNSGLLNLYPWPGAYVELPAKSFGEYWDFQIIVTTASFDQEADALVELYIDDQAIDLNGAEAGTSKNLPWRYDNQNYVSLVGVDGKIAFDDFAIGPLASEATEQTITFLGGLGNRGDIDPFTEASLDGGVTWSSAYLTGWHPWGFAEGTNSWINFDPSPFVGLNTTTDYRIRFIVPGDFTDPSMVFVIKADNRATLWVNDTYISTFDGQGTGSAGDQVVAQAIQAGLNEIRLRLEDWGGWVGLNYRIDVTMTSAEDLSNAVLTIEEADSVAGTSNTAPVADAGTDQAFSCVVNTAGVSLDGSSSSDADGDELSYSWSLNGSVVSIDAAFSTTLVGGSHTFTLTVSDGEESASDEVTVLVELDDTAPDLTAPEDATFYANVAGGYSGSIGSAIADDDCDNDVTVTMDAPAVFPLGNTEVTYTATDAAGNSSTATQVVTVEAFPILIDIKPDDNNNTVNPRNKGVIPVAVLTDGGFDATTLNVASLSFGSGGASAAHNGHFEDVDGDGDVDLMLHFPTRDTGIASGDTMLELTGVTVNGVPVAGSDAVRTVGGKK